MVLKRIFSQFFKGFRLVPPKLVYLMCNTVNGHPLFFWKCPFTELCIEDTYLGSTNESPKKNCEKVFERDKHPSFIFWVKKSNKYSLVLVHVLHDVIP